MPRTNLTDRFCRTVTTDAPADYRDIKVPGLELRVSPPGMRFPEGVKSWRVQYRLPGNRKKNAFKIGRFPDISLSEARATARALFATISKGQDPRHDRQTTAASRERTIKTVWSDYIEFYVTVHNRPRTQRDKQQAFTRYIRPVLGPWPLKEVDRPKLESFLNDLAANGTSTRRKIHRYLSSFWNFALERGEVDHNPFLTLRPPKPAPARERVLDDDEIRAFWEAETHRVYVPMLKIALLTGQRFGSIRTLRWKQIDLKQRLWSIPAEAFKSGKPHSVPLSATASTILENLPRWDAGDYVFTTQGGVKPFGNIGREHAKLLRATGTSGWHRHDVRRTGATILQREGCSMEIIAALLGHKLQGVTPIYLRHDYSTEKRNAVDTLERAVTKILAS